MNVIVSRIWNPHGSPGRIVNALLSEIITVLHDDRILSEYRGVLLPSHLRWYCPTRSVYRFLEVANSGGADALITGNNRALQVGARST
jgi:predicted nucleic acid-binding protein